MADNQHVNKVVYGNTVLIDLTTDTVTAESYSVSPESDLTLYAKATKVGSGVYLKRFGAYSEASSVYKKQNGVWSTIDKSSIDQTKKYELIQ